MVQVCNDNDLIALTNTIEENKLDSVPYIEGQLEILIEHGTVGDVFDICYHDHVVPTLKRAATVVKLCSQYDQSLSKEEFSTTVIQGIEGSASLPQWTPQTEEEKIQYELETSLLKAQATDAEIDKVMATKVAEMDDPTKRFSLIKNGLDYIRNICNPVGRIYNTLPIEEQEAFLNKKFIAYQKTTFSKRVRKSKFKKH